MNVKQIEEIAGKHIYCLVNEQLRREFEIRSAVALNLMELFPEEFHKNGETVNIVEWWTVSMDFIDSADSAGEVTEHAPFGYIWGRKSSKPTLEDPVTLYLLGSLQEHYKG